MKHNYTALDGAIMEALRSGPKVFRSIESYPKARTAAAQLAAEHDSGLYGDGRKKDAWRFIDTRLQALRKKDQIEFIDQARGWALKEQA